MSAGRRAASAPQPHQLSSGAADPQPVLGAGCAPSWEYLIKLLHKHPKTESAELRHVQPT